MSIYDYLSNMGISFDSSPDEEKEFYLSHLNQEELYKKGEKKYQKIFSAKMRKDKYFVDSSAQGSIGLPTWQPLQLDRDVFQSTGKVDGQSTLGPIILELKQSKADSGGTIKDGLTTDVWEGLQQGLHRILSQSNIYGFLRYSFVFVVTGQSAWLLVYHRNVDCKEEITDGFDVKQSVHIFPINKNDEFII